MQIDRKPFSFFFLYCDREKDFKDPEVPNPAKAFRVQRLVPLKGLPFWEIRILKDLGLVYNVSAAELYMDMQWKHLIESNNFLFQAGTDVAIVKNIPENNARLWKIKHCVSVDPIVFPYGEPTANDLNHTFLKQNGECIVTKEISIDPKRLEAAEKFINDKTRLDKDTLKRDALLKWVRNY